MTQWESVKPQVTLLVGEEETPYSVSSFQASFAVNSIPVASLSLPVGVDISRGTVTVPDSFQWEKQKAKVILEIPGYRTNKPKKQRRYAKTKEPITIFEGEIKSVSLRRTRRSLSLAVQLTHFLADLHETSVVSMRSHPGNPNNFTWPAGIPHIAFGGTGIEKGSPGWLSMPPKSVNFAGFGEDLWAKVLKPWFSDFAKYDPIDERLLENADTTLRSIPNQKVLDALDRIQSQALAIDLAPGTNQIVEELFKGALLSTMHNGIVNSTVWSKLVGQLGPHFWFAIYPRCTDAIIAPFVGPLRVPEDKRQEIADALAVNPVGASPQSVRALAIIGPERDITGILGGGKQRGVKYAAVAIWPQPANDSGVVITKVAPPWFRPSYVPRKKRGSPEGEEGNVVRTTATLSAGEVTRKADVTVAIKEARQAQEDMLTKYAHHWYVLERLRQRRASVVLPFSLDTAPGSQVYVFGSRDQKNLAIVGCVTQVELVVDADNARMQTHLQLSHMRTLEEDASDDFSIDGPPFYKEPWYGAALA